mmetsp:Transcript_1825/g.3173  ORF Transcript_1825/g.3173 Transcript_1825/m.3173 type:complete len:208 (+) Transcript_1825:1185-1808(+)
MDVLGHAGAHACGDIRNDFLVGWLKREEAVDHDVELFEQLLGVSVSILVGLVASLGEVGVEGCAQFDSLLCIDRGIIFNGVESAQYEVKDAHWVSKLVVELHDDKRKGSGHLFKVIVAELPFLREWVTGLPQCHGGLLCGGCLELVPEHGQGLVGPRGRSYHVLEHAHDCFLVRCWMAELDCEIGLVFPSLKSAIPCGFPKQILAGF